MTFTRTETLSSTPLVSLVIPNHDKEALILRSAGAATIRAEDSANSEMVPAIALEVLEEGHDRLQGAFQRANTAQQEQINQLREKLKRQAAENEVLKKQVADAQSHIRTIQAVHQSEVTSLQHLVATAQAEAAQKQKQLQDEIDAFQMQKDALQKSIQITQLTNQGMESDLQNLRKILTAFKAIASLLPTLKWIMSLGGRGNAGIHLFSSFETTLSELDKGVIQTHMAQQVEAKMCDILKPKQVSTTEIGALKTQIYALQGEKIAVERKADSLKKEKEMLKSLLDKWKESRSIVALYAGNGLAPFIQTCNEVLEEEERPRCSIQ